MQLKVIVGIVLALFLASMLTIRLNITPVKANSTIIVPDQYARIQWAIGNATAGDTIYVKAGHYYENVVVNKTVSLIGENKSNTIVDGNGTGRVISIMAKNVNFNGFTVQNSGPSPDAGIYIDSGGNNISQNHIIDNAIGIYMLDCCNNSVTDNNIAYNAYGINTLGSGNSGIIGNYITNNVNWGIEAKYSVRTTIAENYIINNTCGIRLRTHTEGSIKCNNIANNSAYGIYIGSVDSYWHNITDNNIINNGYGVWLAGGTHGAHENNIYHNCFMYNTIQAYAGDPSFPSKSRWDDGYPTGGNYWSDYNGTDSYSGPYQNETGSDGIGDTPYIIVFWVRWNNTDYYPLMNNPNAKLSVVPLEQKARALGKVFTINVTVSDVIDLYGFEFKLRYNTTFLDALEVVEGPFLKSGGPTVVWQKDINEKTGVVWFAVSLNSSAHGVAGSGTVATIMFNVTYAPLCYENHSTGLDLYRTILGDYYARRILHAMKDGYYEFVPVIGDVNPDGMVDIYDALKLRAAWGSMPEDTNWNPYADINCDGEINILDAIILGTNWGGSADDPPPAFATAILSVEPSVTYQAPGETFHLKITVANLVDFAGHEFILAYNTSILTPTAYVAGGAGFSFENCTVWKEEINDTQGYVWLAVSLPLGTVGGVSGNKTLARIDFLVDGIGTTFLNLTETKLGDSNGNPIPHAVLNGYFVTFVEIKSNITLNNLRTISLYVNGTFLQGTNLKVRFHSYSGTYQAETTVWTGTTPAYVTRSMNIKHPLNWPIENVTLVITDEYGTILQTVTSFLVHRSHLMNRLGELDFLWTAPGANRTAIFLEMVAMDGQWPYAPP